ncbi:MAG: nuclear transport factor 2 family protein [Candidatus Methylacidiphilales bacterium]|nr:nuclear transport factor 2 family protein [Candidatus Methylacidiphilales bacterium]
MTATPATPTKNESEIQALLTSWFAAIERKDIDAIMAGRSEDLVAFDVPKPFQFKSAADYRAHWLNCLGQMQGSWAFSTREVRITAGEDVAFCHLIMNVKGNMPDGSPMDCDARTTLGFKKVDGAWTVTHEHHSVPMDCPGADAEKSCDQAKS